MTAPRRSLTVSHDVFALSRPFRISRGSRSEAHVLTVELAQGGARGRGECTPYPRYGESVASCTAQIEEIREALQGGAGLGDVEALLPAGAARNAIDCALWDIEARLTGVTVARRLGVAPSFPMVSGATVGVDDPAVMADEARGLADAPLLKVKVAQEGALEALRAVRAAAPRPRLIVDPNESWSVDFLADAQGALEALRVDLIEQPIPAAESAALQGFDRRLPICADEAAHTSHDVEALRGRYDVVNIKLDKTGGLTEALRLAARARAAGLGVMVGCMLSSSLSIAPATFLAAAADFTDLDGPYLFTQDREGGFRFVDGWMQASAPGFWGG